MKLHEALSFFEKKIEKDGKPHLFSIKFIKTNGELVYIPKGTPCGVNNKSMKHSHYRGIQPYGVNGKLGHPTPVYIFSIIELNGNPVL